MCARRKYFQPWWFLEAGICWVHCRYHPHTSSILQYEKEGARTLCNSPWSWDMIGKVVIISRLSNTAAASGAVLASVWCVSSHPFISDHQLYTERKAGLMNLCGYNNFRKCTGCSVNIAQLLYCTGKQRLQHWPLHRLSSASLPFTHSLAKHLHQVTRDRHTWLLPYSANAVFWVTYAFYGKLILVFNFLGMKTQELPLLMDSCGLAASTSCCMVSSLFLLARQSILPCLGNPERYHWKIQHIIN